MKTAVLYLFLVGAPVLGLFAVLRTGERLVPPHSVGGAWVLEDPSLSVTEHPCIGLEFEVERPTVSVAQSGPRVVLTFNNTARTVFIGELRDSAITARPQDRALGGRCADLTLQLEPAAPTPDGRPRFVGAIHASGCADCEPIPIAIRRRLTPAR